MTSTSTTPNTVNRTEFVKFALDHIDRVPPSKQIDLLTTAAGLLKTGELADLCRATASALRVAEMHQLKLFAAVKK
jgi:hypothetical protein